MGCMDVLNVISQALQLVAVHVDIPMHTYPFNVTDPTGPKRTTSAHASDAKKEYLENSLINGIKAPHC